MLTRLGRLKPMRPQSSQQPFQELRALRDDIAGADDQKIRQIVHLLDQTSENQASQAVMDPLRPRLAALRPIRPLRFARLLFMPLDDLIVAAPDWKPGHATVPRSVLKSMSDTVQMKLGRDLEDIKQLIGGARYE